MSAALPERVDVARQVQAGRAFEGSLPLASMRRLAGSLANTVGAVRYSVQFGRDATLGVSFIELRVQAELPLVCQRSMEVFLQPVALDQRLGVIAEERDEAALPEGYEPLLAPDGMVDVADVIEDELILALPVVALKPGLPLDWRDPSAPADADEPTANPFAVLGQLSRH